MKETMAKIDLILLATLALVLSVQSCFANIDLSSLEQYLDLPKEQFPVDDQTIRNALVKLQVGLGESTSSVLSKIKSLSRSMDEHREIYECLDIFCANIKRDVPFHCVHDLKSIVVQVSAEPKGELGRLTNLMRKCTNGNFGQLVKNRSKELSMTGKNVASSLDELFVGAFDMEQAKVTNPGQFSDKHQFLIKFLEGFNMAEGKMNVRKMVAAAKGGKSDVPKGSLRPLVTGMDQACVELHSNRYSLVLIILFNLMTGDELQSVKLQKLVEYQRICSAWVDQDTRPKIIANIEKQFV